MARGRKAAEAGYGHLYSSPKGLDTCTCFYCGSIAEHQDHVPALSTISSLGTHAFVGYRLLLIPACAECNGRLSNLLLPTVKLRCQYLVGKYVTEYSAILLRPEWREELYDLKGNLRQYVQSSQDSKLVLERRLDYLWSVDYRLHLLEAVKPYAEDYSIDLSKFSRRKAIEYVEACKREHREQLIRSTGKFRNLEESGTQVVTAQQWNDFSRVIQTAEADAVDLNVAIENYYSKI